MRSTAEVAVAIRDSPSRDPTIAIVVDAMDVVRQPTQGWIEVVVGSMFSGKSEELIRRAAPRADRPPERADLQAAQSTPASADDHIVSHSEHADSRRRASRQLARAARRRWSRTPRSSASTKGSSSTRSCRRSAAALADRGMRVIVAGLDQDYLGKPFEPMPQLLAIAEYITKTLRHLHGVRQPRQPHAAAGRQQRPRAASARRAPTRRAAGTASTRRCQIANRRRGSRPGRVERDTCPM